MERRSWMDYEHKEEDAFETAAPFDDEVVSVPPSEVKLEHMLENRLTLDAVDMGTLPGVDLKAWNDLRRANGAEFTLGEGAVAFTSPRSSLLGAGMTRTDSTRSLASMRDQMTSPVKMTTGTQAQGRMSRLRTSGSLEKFEEGTTPLQSPRSSERRSSNLSQMISTLKKSPSMEIGRSALRDDNNGNSPPPPPPKNHEGGNLLGQRRQSNLAIMRVIAESI